MGQKVNPIGFRTGITRDWTSRWYAKKKDFGNLLVQDVAIRKFIKKNYGFAGIPKIEIERRGDEVLVILYVARAGVIIGRKGTKVDKLKDELENITGVQTQLKILEVDEPELQAQLVAENISEQLARRSAFRRTLARTVETTMGRGALGVKILISGRLGGAEMARKERVVGGSVPLSTLRADIDYGFAESRTQYGHIGVKVWIYKGLIEENTNAPVDAQAGKVSQDSEGPH